VLLDLLWLTSQTNEVDHGKSASDTSSDKQFPWSLKFSQTTAKTNTAATSWRKAAAAVMTSSETERVIDGPFAIKEAVSNDELAAHTMLELLRVCENEKVP
jgi:negative regulator of replication initiation